jgi:hypothetical protein
MKPYRINEIDPSRIVFSSIFAKSDGKRYVPIKYNDERNGLTDLVFQTTELYCDQLPENKGDYWELNMPLYGNDQSRVLQLINFLQSLDKKVVNEIEATNYEWFGDNENSEFKYKNQVRIVQKPDKYRKQGELKVKIMDTNMFRPQILDNNMKKIGIRDIKKGTWLRFMFHCVAVWIKDNGSGLYLKPIKISQRQKTQPVDYEFVDDSDDEKILDTEFGPFLHTAAPHTETATARNGHNHFIKPVKSVGKIKVTQNVTSVSNIPVGGFGGAHDKAQAVRDNQSTARGSKSVTRVKKSHYTPLNETTYEQSSESSDASNTDTDEWKHKHRHNYRRTIEEESDETSDDASDNNSSKSSKTSNELNNVSGGSSDNSSDNESDNSSDTTSNDESNNYEDSDESDDSDDSDNSDTSSDDSDTAQVDERIYEQFIEKHKNQFDIDSSTVHATSIVYNNYRHKLPPRHAPDLTNTDA